MAGGLVGAGVLGVFIALGVLLSSRVSNLLPLVILGVAGAYAAWLLGVVVFGAVRGGSDETTP
ncbi:MAG TPA: hypothetical protein VHO95_03180 [Candidatus Dormibacteraeota bacterium]|nr:hypothetical protein [Candidatus Dormibacteraeota bacterium]